MRYRTHRGEQISEIGFGCYGLSGAYGRKDPERFIPLIRRAYDLGVTFFDTADVYGPAEEVLGRAVAPFRDRVWIATKVGGRADSRPNASARYIRSSCLRSLQRLRTDYIDLYQVHFDDPSTPVEETVAALEELRVAGHIRHYGVGHLPTPRMEAYFRAGDVFSALVELSAVARKTREEVLPLCREHGVGVIAFSVTGRGLLTGRIGADHVFEEGDIRRVDPLFQRERLTSGLRVAARFRALGEKHGKTSVQVAIAWALAQPGVVCALTGPSTIPHLEENLGGSGWTIPPDDLAELERFFQEEEAWLRREQVRHVHSILAQDLDPRRAFADLVYVCEALMEMSLATEEEIIPLFQRLWALRERRDDEALGEMREIQEALRARFLPRLVAGTTGETA